MPKCEVFGCKSNTNKSKIVSTNKTVRLHRFPKDDLKIQKLWVDFCCKNKEINIKNGKKIMYNLLLLFISIFMLF